MPRFATIQSVLTPGATGAAGTVAHLIEEAADKGAPADQDLHIGKDGTVTIDPADPHQEEQKTAKGLEQTGRWYVIPILDEDFAEVMRRLAISYHDTGQTMVMTRTFGSLADLVAKRAGATLTGADSAGTAPQYKGLPEAAAASADSVEQFPIQTHNAHADPKVLRAGGLVLTALLTLDQIFEQGATQIGLTTAPLARQIAGTVSDVCAAVQKELPRNPALQRALGPALSYTADRVALAQSTKKKIKKAKAQAASSGGGQKPGDQGTPPASTGSQGGNNPLK